jgi:uncharacterized RDD family membrane protein YckC
LAAVPEPARTAPAPAPAAPPARAPRQGLLFQEKPAGKVIPFEALTAPAPPPPAAPPSKPAVARTSTRVQARRAADPGNAQPSLDFLPPAPPAARKLGTTVEAVIFCDAQVAAPMHRACAAAIDGSMIVIACGLFVTAAGLLGGGFGSGKLMFLTLGVSALLISMFYGFVWVCAGGQSLGMRATRLTLINFDGYPPDRVSRWMRFLGACLSYCAVLGILWALVDEESLAWHDHISKTFPTFREPETNFVHRR